MTDRIRLLLKPWSYSVRTRLALLVLFCWTGRFALAELAQNIVDSDAVRKRQLAGADALPDRTDVLRRAVEETRNVPGIVAEFGVFEGFTLKLLADAVGNDVRAVGFDSFEGLPEPMADLLPVDCFKTDVPEFSQTNIALEIGYFEDTLRDFIEREKPQFRVIHIDCDLYSATLYVLELIRPLLAPGAVIVFDEYYGYPQYENLEFKAWHEFISKHGIAAEAIAYSSHSCAFRVGA
jgi:hypothetical protein